MKRKRLTKVQFDWLRRMVAEGPVWFHPGTGTRVANTLLDRGVAERVPGTDFVLAATNYGREVAERGGRL